MKQIRIPSYLHEVLGERQSVASILAVLGFAVLMSAALFFRYPVLYDGLASWRSVLAIVLIVDICAGCIANFTSGTNRYYAERPRLRLVFIAVHVHLVLIALLLGTSLSAAIGVWLYTIICAFVVNACANHSHQVLIGGLLLAAGLGWVPMVYAAEPHMLIVSLLFMLKVLYSFSVNHGARMIT